MTEEKSVHKLKKSSAYSFSVTIPKEIVEKYGWKEKRKLVDCAGVFCLIERIGG